MAAGSTWSKTWTYFEGDWHEGNVPIMGPRTHAAWLCSLVFDGARAFEEASPPTLTFIAHASTTRRKSSTLNPLVSAEEWINLAHEGIARFDSNVSPLLHSAHVPGRKKEAPGFSLMTRNPLGGASASMRRPCARPRVSR